MGWLSLLSDTTRFGSSYSTPKNREYLQQECLAESNTQIQDKLMVQDSPWVSCFDTSLDTDQHWETQSLLRTPSFKVHCNIGVKKMQFSLYSTVILPKPTVTSSCPSKKMRTQVPKVLESSLFNTHALGTSFHLQRWSFKMTEYRI